MRGLPSSPPSVYKDLVARDFGTARAAASPMTFVDSAAVFGQPTAFTELTLQARRTPTPSARTTSDVGLVEVPLTANGLSGRGPWFRA